MPGLRHQELNPYFPIREFCCFDLFDEIEMLKLLEQNQTGKSVT